MTLPGKMSEINQMKKICYVVTIPGTIEAFFIPQLKYLASNGFDVTVVCANSSVLQKELGETINFHPIGIPRGISVRGSIYALKMLRCFFEMEQFDLIQYSTPNATFYASIAAKKAGCKIRNYHLMGFRYLGASGIGRILLKFIEKVTCRNSTSIECVSKSNLELGIQENLFKRDKVTVIWNGSTGGVDLKRFDYQKRNIWRKDVRENLGFSDVDFIYGFVGRITRDKGINELLGAFLKLKNDSKLLLLGNFENVETLNQKLLEEAKKNENIVFHDAVSDVERYYAAIDVLVLPSYREGFGNVVIEAGAVGTPAIISDISGLIDTIKKEETALVVQARNTAILEKQLIQIHERNYMAMGQNAAYFAKKMFDSHVMNEKILERKLHLLEK